MRVIATAMLVCVVSAGCGEKEPPLFAVVEEHNPPPSFGELFDSLRFSTYEGSGETVHPDFAEAPAWWDGDARYLAVTPYPNANAAFENPSLFSGTEIRKWNVPEAGHNPIARPAAGYLSDPDITFDDDTHEMRMYYRGVDQRNEIFLIRSHDAVTWSDPVVVVSGLNHTVISPSVTRVPGEGWLMWSVNSGPSGCSAASTSVEVRRSEDGITWSDPAPVSIELAPSGRTPWHLEAQWIESRGEFWMVFNGMDPGRCGTTALYLATSQDGVHWKTFPRPLLVAGEIPELKDIVYRSTFRFDAVNSRVTFWYSGAHRLGDYYRWKTVAHRLSIASLLARVKANGASASRFVPPSVFLPNPP